MSGITKTITVNTPAVRVFDTMSDPWNTAQIWPQVVSLYDIERLSPRMWHFRWVRKFENVRFQGLTEMVLFPPDRGMMTEVSGGLRFLSAWSLETVAEGTLVVLSVDYTLPAPLLQKHPKEMVTTDFEADLQQTLVNLKRLAESSTPPRHHEQSSNTAHLPA
jgi:hypothetical protein